MDRQEVLRIENLSTYGYHNSSLNNLNFQLMNGEIHGVLGTQAVSLDNFIRFFEHKLEIRQGKILYHGKPCSMIRLLQEPDGLSVVPQDDFLYSNFTVLENIFFMDSNYVHFKGKKRIMQCRRLFDRWQIDIDITKKVSSLTKEERKMVELIHIYMKNPKIVLLHETMLYLGDKLSVRLPAILEDWKKKNISIIYLSTQIDDILSLSDRISIIQNGVIRGTIDAGEAKANPRHLINMLSGWDFVARTNPNESERELLEVLSTARSIMNTGTELKKIFGFLAANLQKLMYATNCIIYVVDKENNFMFDSVLSGDKNGKLLPITLQEMVFRQDACITLENSMLDFNKLFYVPDNIVQVYCFPIFVRSEIRALIQLAYHEYHLITEQDLSIVSTFCKEIKIAIETSIITDHSTLLQESHHRIKNNLQVIISLLYMQKGQIMDTNVTPEDIISTIIYRIKSIAAIHDLLSKDRFGWNNIELKSLIQRVIGFYAITDINIILDIDNISIPYNKAASFALVVNELISNCTKHAFTGDKYKEIRVICRNEQDKLKICVRDNGTGIPETFANSRQNSVGLNVIRSIISELKASIQFSTDNGSVVTIEIPREELYRV